MKPTALFTITALVVLAATGISQISSKEVNAVTSTVIYPWNLDERTFISHVEKLKQEAIKDTKTEEKLRDLFFLSLISDTSCSEAVSNAIEAVRDKIGIEEFRSIVRKQPYSMRQNLLQYYENQ